MKLNVGTHDFAALVPAIVESVRRNFRPGSNEHASERRVRRGGLRPASDGDVLKNLLYNAARHARSEVRFHSTCGTGSTA